MNELPKGWAATTLWHVSLDCAQRIPVDDEQFQYIDIASIDRDKKTITSPQALLGKDAPSRARKHVAENDVLVSMTRPNLNAVALVPKPLDGQIASTGFEVLRAAEIDPRWIFYTVQSAKFVERMCELVQGALYPAVRGKDIRDYQIPLAPIPEQKRIADKLDGTLARVDACRDRLDRLPALLKRFRQSVLGAGTSGRLTEDWRTTRSPDEAQCNPEIAAPNSGADAPASGLRSCAPTTVTAVDALWKTPDSWQWAAAEHVCHFITKGTTPSKESMTAASGDIPYVKVYNLTFDGTLDFSVNPTFVDTATHESDLKRSQVLPGDVLMNIVGPPLGKVSVVPPTYPEWNINQAIARFRPAAGLQSRYLGMCLRSTQLIEHASRHAKATAGQFNLTLEICRALPIPVPSLDEQHEIIRRVETLFAFADRLEARLDTARKQAEQLTPALLAKAFRGELVPQDPNDEPASELLKRLAASRTDAPRPRRGRKAAA